MAEAFIYRRDAEEWLVKKYELSVAEAAEVVALHWNGRRVAVTDLEREMYSRGHKTAGVR